jgi:hypothetical protein
MLLYSPLATVDPLRYVSAEAVNHTSICDKKRKRPWCHVVFAATAEASIVLCQWRESNGCERTNMLVLLSSSTRYQGFEFPIHKRIR